MSNYNNEFKKHKASDMIKWIVAFFLILALMASVAMIGLKVFGVLDKIAPEQEPETEDVDVDPESALFGYETQGILISRTALAASGSPTANTSKTQRFAATVQPAEAAQEVNWALSFKNPASEWATGKDINEYAQISVDGSNSCICDFTLKQAFGEQIVLKASAKSDSTKYCDVTIDYAMPLTLPVTARARDILFGTSNGSGNVFKDSLISMYKSKIVKGTGTYYDENYEISMTLTYGGWMDTLKSQLSGHDDIIAKLHNSTDEVTDTLLSYVRLEQAHPVDGGTKLTFNSETDAYSFLFTSTDFTNDQKNIINAAIKACEYRTNKQAGGRGYFATNPNTCLIKAVVTISYCGTLTKSYELGTSWLVSPSFTTYPTSVSVDNQSVLFGEADSE